MPKHTVYLWKQVPFVRLLVPFIAGIILQWYLRFSFLVVACVGLAAIILSLLYFFLPATKKFSFKGIQGVFIQALMFAVGCAITYDRDITHNELWVGKHYKDSSAILITLQEPLVEKTKSYKALASIDAIQVDGKWKYVKGNILAYFRKDSTPPMLKYGSQIVLTKPLQAITNSGNPGAFNYQRYSAFQDIHHQVFLKSSEYINTGKENINGLKQWLFNIRFAVINTLRKYIYDEKEEAVAEALLIGYRDDLDKDLVQAYSNTGVVHIIAISGLHLGLIYGAMVWFFKLFKRRRWIYWVKPLVILLVLWTFSLVAGAAPSILRSAVMFTFIILGETITRKTSIYNTLAASTFVMLCYNPFFLWDVGFQLSYAAVLSIVAFMQPVYNWFYIRNKFLNGVWKLNAVTLSAQVLTVPIVLYHFHQFPNLFLVTNFVAVPLSSIILFGELLLLVTSFIPAVAGFFGAVNSWMLRWMNNFIERMNEIPFSVTEGIQVSVVETILLYITFIALAIWLLRKSRLSFIVGVAVFVAFVVVRSFDIRNRGNQKKLIVYNVPQHAAFDIINGNDYKFIGDTAVLTDNFLQNFHLKPSRTLHRIRPADNLSSMHISYPFISFNQQKILVVDRPLKFVSEMKIPVDVIILSRNPRIYISQLAAVFDCKRYVFDASNPLWKIKLWKKDCDSLHLPHHSIPEKGAFEMEL
jgi:competence protein ComEC